MKRDRHTVKVETTCFFISLPPAQPGFTEFYRVLRSDPVGLVLPGCYRVFPF